MREPRLRANTSTVFPSTASSKDLLPSIFALHFSLFDLPCLWVRVHGLSFDERQLFLEEEIILQGLGLALE